MNYSETIQYLYETLPMFSRVGAKAIKLDLEKTRQLCDWLGNPELKVKTIHVAGTNGKGSVSSMLAAVFQEHGYKTGLYTSPHLRDFRERIRVDGGMVPEKFVIDFVEKSKSVTAQIHPSFFELTFVMALDYFVSQHIDIAIIETGLGGRLDSTNVIMPELSVITNIGMDHTDVLGDTMEKIAAEKAGIIKDRIPVVVGESHPETMPVFVKAARQKHAPLFFADERFDARLLPGEIGIVHVTDRLSAERQTYHPDLHGSYQLKNLVTVLQSLSVLQGVYEFKPPLVQTAISHVGELTGLQGRWQIIHEHPRVVLDVAHNVDGIRQIFKDLTLRAGASLHIVTGMVKDKDHDAVFQILPPDAHYYFTQAQIPRALPADELLKKTSAFGLRGTAFDDVNQALREALRCADAKDLVLVCGSVFVIGEVDIEAVMNVPEIR